MQKKMKHSGNGDMCVTAPLGMAKSERNQMQRSKTLSVRWGQIGNPARPTVSAADNSIGSGVVLIPKSSKDNRRMLCGMK